MGSWHRGSAHALHQRCDLHEVEGSNPSVSIFLVFAAQQCEEYASPNPIGQLSMYV